MYCSHTVSIMCSVFHGHKIHWLWFTFICSDLFLAIELNKRYSKAFMKRARAYEKLNRKEECLQGNCQSKRCNFVNNCKQLNIAFCKFSNFIWECCGWLLYCTQDPWKRSMEKIFYHHHIKKASQKISAINFAYMYIVVPV